MLGWAWRLRQSELGKMDKIVEPGGEPQASRLWLMTNEALASHDSVVREQFVAKSAGIWLRGGPLRRRA